MNHLGKILLGALLLSACATASRDISAMSVKEQMKEVVDPASATVFAIGGDADPDNRDAPAISAARWTEGLKAAEQLKAAADSMLLPTHAKDQGDWASLARQMSDLSQTAIAAAQAKDRAAFYAASNNLSDNCAACHGKYKNLPAA